MERELKIGRVAGNSERKSNYPHQKCGNKSLRRYALLPINYRCFKGELLKGRRMDLLPGSLPNSSANEARAYRCSGLRVLTPVKGEQKKQTEVQGPWKRG